MIGSYYRHTDNSIPLLVANKRHVEYVGRNSGLYRMAAMYINIRRRVFWMAYIWQWAKLHRVVKVLLELLARVFTGDDLNVGLVSQQTMIL